MCPQEMSQALDLAYSDVRRAFLHMLDDPDTAGRPFILAGHSQGTMHMVRLLQEEVEGHPERCARFVHAYLAGYSVPLYLFSRSLREVRPSTSASDICSVSSWRTAAVGHVSQKILRLAAFYAGEGWRLTEESEMLTTNPITWSQGPDDDTSDPAAFCGALWPVPTNMDEALAEEGGLISSMNGLRFGHRSGRQPECAQGPARSQGLLVRCG